ncbi:hypothetical protein [Staphylococcus equorum]|uniref:hypothetical protein n=1 Tax=Staphylococcus equorum TaxID=246432 RepID=UPI003CF2EA7D
MILSDTQKMRYKLDTKDMNITQMSRLLKEHGIKGFLMGMTARNITVAVPCEEIPRNRMKVKEMIKDMED